MRTPTKLSLFGAALFFAGVALASPPAPSATQEKAAGDEAPAKTKPRSGGTAKAGEACKSSNDCDQSAPQSCVKNKCEAAKQAVPPPTT